MKKLRILLVTDTHRPLGGAEKHFFRLKEELKGRAEVFSFGFAGTEERGADFLTLKDSAHPRMRQVWKLIPNPRVYAKLKAYAASVRPDVVHLHNANRYTATVLAALRPYPVVHTVHDYGLLCPNQWNLHRDLSVCASGLTWACLGEHRHGQSWPSYLVRLAWFWRKRSLLRRAVVHFVAPSPALKECLSKAGFKPVTRISTYLPMNEIPNPAAGGDPKGLLYLGLLEENKGVHLLLEALPEIQRRIPGVHLTVAGEGSWKARLQDRVRVLGLPGVRFVGWVGEPGPLYRRAGLVVVPSLGLETGPLTAAEAMSQGRPVVGSDRGGIAWLVEHGKTGMLFDPLKKGDLAAQVVKVLARPARMKQMGLAGNRRIRRLASKKETLAAYLDLYRKVQETPRSGFAH